MEDSTSKLTLQLDLARSRIRVHRKTLAALGNPEYILLIVNPEEKTLESLKPPIRPVPTESNMAAESNARNCIAPHWLGSFALSCPTGSTVASIC